MNDAAEYSRTRAGMLSDPNDGIKREHVEKPANTSKVSSIEYETEPAEQLTNREFNGEGSSLPLSPRDSEPPSPPFDDHWKSVASSDNEAEDSTSGLLNRQTESDRDSVAAGSQDETNLDHSESSFVPQRNHHGRDLDREKPNQIRRMASERTRKHELIRFAALCPHLYHSLTTYSTADVSQTSSPLSWHCPSRFYCTSVSSSLCRSTTHFHFLSTRLPYTSS